MNEMTGRFIRCGAVVALALGAPAGVATAQENEATAPDIHNVLLTFHLIQADGFTDEDPEISDVVGELRNVLGFKGYRLLSTSIFNIGLVRSSRGTYVSGDGSQRIYPRGSETPLAIKAQVSSNRAPPGTVRATVTLTDETTRPAGRQTVGRTERFPLLEASVTIRDAQRVVLGSARRTPDEPVLILVVKPRIDP